MEEVNNLKISMATMEGDIKNIKEGMSEIKSSIKEFHTTFQTEMRDFKCDVNTALSGKANRWVEWFAKILTVALATGIIGFIIFTMEKMYK